MYKTHKETNHLLFLSIVSVSVFFLSYSYSFGQSATAPVSEVKIILEEYSREKSDVYTCRENSSGESTQSCLTFNRNITSSTDKLKFTYPYTSTNNVTETVTENYTEDFAKSYRIRTCTIEHSLNQLSNNGKSKKTCGDEVIYDVDTERYDPVFNVYSPEMVKGSGNTVINGEAWPYITNETIKEDSKTYLVLEGGDPDSFYEIPLVVSVFSILPWNMVNEAGVDSVGRNGWVNNITNPIVCTSISVAGETAKGNAYYGKCIAKIFVKGNSKTYITPTIKGNVSYFGYGFGIDGGYINSSETNKKQGKIVFGVELKPLRQDELPRSVQKTIQRNQAKKGLTSRQADSILNLLSSFGADQGVVENVRSILFRGIEGDSKDEISTSNNFFLKNLSSTFSVFEELRNNLKNNLKKW